MRFDSHAMAGEKPLNEMRKSEREAARSAAFFQAWIRASAAQESDGGTALIEFALVLTVLLMFLFGTMDFARALYAYHFVGNAAREGVRYAIVRGKTCTSWPTACPATATDIQNYLKNVPTGIDPSAVSVTSTWTPDNKPGSVVHVQVQYSFRFILPLLPKAALVMTSASQMVISQ